MKSLEILTDKAIQHATDAGLFDCAGDPTPEALHDAMNIDGYFVTIHNVQDRCCLYINDVMQEFYGFDSNFMRDRHIGFYLKTNSPMSFHSLLVSAQFFSRADPGFLNTVHKLRAADKSIHNVPTVSKTCSLGAEGRPLHAISISCLEDELQLMSARALYDLSALKPRDLICLKALLKGQSNTQIADLIDLSEKSVELINKGLLRTTGAKNRYELIQACSELV